MGMAGASLVSQGQLSANNGHPTVSGTHRVSEMAPLQAEVKLQPPSSFQTSPALVATSQAPLLWAEVFVSG